MSMILWKEKYFSTTLAPSNALTRFILHSDKHLREITVMVKKKYLLPKMQGHRLRFCDSLAFRTLVSGLRLLLMLHLRVNQLLKAPAIH